MKSIELPDHPRRVILPGIRTRPLGAHKTMPPTMPGVAQRLDLNELLGERLEGFNARFWDRVDVRDDHPCWGWTGCVSKKGYGARNAGRRKGVSAHRVAYALANSVVIPHGVMVCHSCGTRLCCNPAHLYLGDYRGNRVTLGPLT